MAILVYVELLHLNA